MTRTAKTAAKGANARRDAIALPEEDHRKVLDPFQQFEKARGRKRELRAR